MTEARGASFGARFIAEVRRGLGTTSHWSYASLQALDVDDREDFVGVLRKSDPYMSYELIQTILTQEPETAARQFVEYVRSQAAG
jgi:hypothetical protein